MNIVTFISYGLLPIAYYIIFAHLASSFFKEIPAVRKKDLFLKDQWFSVLILAVIVFPLIIKKKIQELKIAGILLFSGVILFIVLMVILRATERLSYDEDTEPHKFYDFKIDKDFLSSLSTALVAYGFQSAFFPIYNSLKVQTYKNAMSFTIYGIGF